MHFFIDFIFGFIFFAVIILLVFLVYLHISYFIALIQKRLEKKFLKYSTYLKNKVTKQKFMVVLLWIPLCLVIILVIAPAITNALHSTYSLRSEIKDATKLRIMTISFHSKSEFDTLLFESVDTDQIKGLVNKFSILPMSPFSRVRCACMGDLLFEFYDGDKIIRSFSLHGESHIRVYGRFSSDLFLSSGSRKSLHTWLLREGIRQKLEANWKDQR